MAERPRGQEAHDDYGTNPCGVVYCPVCQDDALPHSASGRCMWCDTLLVTIAVPA